MNPVEKAIDKLLEGRPAPDGGSMPSPRAQRRLDSRNNSSVTQEEIDAMWKLATDDGEAEDLMQGMEDFESAVTARVGQWEGVSADYKDSEELAESFKEALSKLGIAVFTNPQTAGSDMFGFILVKK